MTITHEIRFHGDVLKMIEHEGNPFVAVKPVCDYLGLNWSSQFRKIMDPQNGWKHCLMAMVGADLKDREMVCLSLIDFPLWLASISPSKIKEDVRVAFLRYRNEAKEVLFRHFMKINSDRERKSETRSIALLAELCTKKPILGKVRPLALAGRNFTEIKAAWPSYTKARIVEALEDLVRLKSLDQLPAGMPLLKSQNVTLSTADTNQLPLFG